MAIAKKAEKEIDIAAVLASASTNGTTKKNGSKVPVIDVTVDTKKLVKKYQETDVKMTELDALKSELQADIINNVTPIYEEKCKMDFTSSVKVPSTDDTFITMSGKSAYSKVDPTNESAIKSVVGANYDRWFTKESTVTLKDMSKEFLQKLIAFVGPEHFGEFFEVVQSISPTANFTEEKYRTLTAEQRASLNDVVKQYKPAIRAK
jgi:hypothetical protein